MFKNFKKLKDNEQFYQQVIAAFVQKERQMDFIYKEM